MVEKEACMKCCVHFWRLAFIILNSIFFLIGLSLVALAIYLLATDNNLSFFTGNRIASGGALILIAGVITTIISFIGILGAIGMWPVLLIIYLVLLFVIVVLEIVAGVLGFVYRNALLNATGDRSADAISRYRPAGDPELSSDVNSVLDFVQTRFRCCGYLSPSDWVGTVFFNESDGLYPDSCNCTDSSGRSCITLDTTQVIYNASCDSSLNAFLEANLAIVGGVGIAFGIFELIGIALGIALTICFCVIQKKDKDEFNFSKAV